MAVYVVIGATKAGIGKAITARLHSDGHTVIGTYDAAEEKDAKEFAASLKNLGLYLVDYSKTSSLNEFIQTLPAKVNGVAIAQMYFDIRQYDDFSEENWQKCLSVNLTMPHYLTLSMANRMTEGASFVTITSTEGFVGSFGAAGYAATKAALHNLVKTHANNLGHIKVRANAVAAGWIGGVMDTDEVFNMSRKITPLQRLGDPKEIAAVVNFLLSPESSFITGATIVADGGYTCVDTISQYEYQTI